MNEDFAELVKLLNRRRPQPSRAFQSRLAKVNIGTRVGGAVKKKAKRKINRHLAKFLACGKVCFRNVRQYFEDDFRLLHFPLFLVRAIPVSCHHCACQAGLLQSVLSSAPCRSAPRTSCVCVFGNPHNVHVHTCS